VPLVNPLNIVVVSVPDTSLIILLLLLTLYIIIEDPPLLDGIFHDTLASALPAVAETDVGAHGTENGIIELDGLDAIEAPATFIA